MNQTTAIQDIPLGENNISTVDQLGMDPYVSALTEFIKSCGTPMTIAIQGDWGTGKTSIMRMIEQRLNKEEAVTVWFNTWQYSQFSLGDLISLSFISQLCNEILPKNGAEKAKDLVKDFAKEFASSVLPFVAKAGAAYLSAGLTQAVGQDANVNVDLSLKRLQAANDSIMSLKKNFGEAVKARLKTEGKDDSQDRRIVIFVDDLDRVPPIRAIELLETMKMFADVPQCVFVLALDYNVVVRGLKEKFNTSEDDLGGRSFFDKIIQLPFSMPTANYRIEEYLKNIFTKVEIEFSEQDISLYKSLLENSIGFNPRSTKRLVNVIKIFKLVEKNTLSDRGAVQQDAMTRNRVLFALVCLQAAYEPVFHFLRNKLTPDTLEQMKSGDLYTDNFSRIAGDSKQALKIMGLSKGNILKFSKSFVKAVQLDSNDAISDEEIRLLESIMRTLAITSVGDGVSSVDGEHPLQSLVRQVTQRISEKYPDLPSDVPELEKRRGKKGKLVRLVRFNINKMYEASIEIHIDNDEQFDGANVFVELLFNGGYVVEQAKDLAGTKKGTVKFIGEQDRLRGMLEKAAKSNSRLSEIQYEDDSMGFQKEFPGRSIGSRDLCEEVAETLLQQIGMLDTISEQWLAGQE